MSNWIQRYIDAPKAGRLAPQPNREMFATRMIMRLLGLK
jgi:hypothetical protein